MSFRIIGIDPGSRRTGWAVLEIASFGRPFNLLSCGLIDVSKSIFPDNLGKIFYELDEIVRGYSPGIMSLESLFSGVNPSSLIKLSQARGVICSLSSIYKMKLKEYSPRFVKKSIAGYGDADKDQIREAITLICNNNRYSHNNKNYNNNSHSHSHNDNDNDNNNNNDSLNNNNGNDNSTSEIIDFLQSGADNNITDAIAIAVCCATDMSNFV